MKVLVKILCLTIILGVIMIILEMNISYGAVSISPSRTTVNPGDQITVTVTVSGVAAWNVPVVAEGPVSGGTIRVVGDSPDGNNTTYSQSATFTATGVGTIRFYTSGADTTRNQDGQGVQEYPNASATVTVVEKQEEPSQPTSPSKPSNTQTSTKKPETTSTNTPEDEEEIADTVIAQTVIDMINAIKSKAQAIVDMMNALNDATASYPGDVAAARAAYETLTDAQKELITNYKDLLSSEEELEQAEKEEKEVVENVVEEKEKEPRMFSMPLVTFIGLQVGIIVVELGVIIGLNRYARSRRRKQKNLRN